MNIQLIRHATLWLEYNGLTILVDPMLSDKDENPPIGGSANSLRNPMVTLPLSVDHLLNPDLILVTHLHKDHWDAAAENQLPKSTPILCQPGDEATLIESGFHLSQPIHLEVNYQGITISRTGGQHGTGDIGERMGQVSGFVLKAEGEPTLYIAGDTIYCEEVGHSIAAYQPEIIVVNAGGARFLAGDPITMTPEHVMQVCEEASNARVIAIHMDTINHCEASREILRSALQNTKYADQVLIPEDGQWL